MVGLVDIGSAVGAIMGGLDDLFTNDEERAAGELKVQALFMQPHVLQAMANLKEAEHPSVFVAGWRPGLGWVCVVALAWTFIIRPIGMWVGFMFGVDMGDAPELQTEAIMGLVLALLGLAGTRAAEKIKKVARIG